MVILEYDRILDFCRFDDFEGEFDRFDSMVDREKGYF